MHATLALDPVLRGWGFRMRSWLRPDFGGYWYLTADISMGFGDAVRSAQAVAQDGIVALDDSVSWSEN